MNKSELIEAIAKSAKISKASAGSALDGALSAIKGALKKNESVTLISLTPKIAWRKVSTIYKIGLNNETDFQKGGNKFIE